MPRRPDPLFSIPKPEAFTEPVLDLLGGVARPRPLAGDEAIAALGRIEAAAKGGDPRACAELARRLLTEEPGARTNRRALGLLRKSAAADYPEGLHLLGLLHMRGQGLRQDKVEGARLIERAALLGSCAAQCDMARACLLGAGAPANAARALYWLRLAAAQGDAQEALRAGRMYREGEGCARGPESDAQAARWLELAARAGVPQAQYGLAELLRRARDPARARQWMREAAFSGIVDAQFRIGVANWSGAGGSVDQREAVRWLCRAAEGGSPRAAAMLAGFLMTGNGLPLSASRAWTLFRWAERLGDADSAATARILERQLSEEERAAGLALLTSAAPREILERLIPRAER